MRVLMLAARRSAVACGRGDAPPVGWHGFFNSPSCNTGGTSLKSVTEIIKCGSVRSVVCR